MGIVVVKRYQGWLGKGCYGKHISQLAWKLWLARFMEIDFITCFDVVRLLWIDMPGLVEPTQRLTP